MCAASRGHVVSGDGAPARATPLVGLLVAFALTRLAVWWLYAPGIGSGDETQYVRVAQSLLEHGLSGYLDPPYRLELVPDFYPYFHGHRSLPDGQYNPVFWDPLYPAVLAAVSATLGPSFDVVRALQVVLSALTMLLGMRVVRDVFPGDRRAETFFGVLFVANLAFAGYATKLLGETIDALLMTALFWLALRLGRDRLRDSIALGLLLGVYVSLKSYWLQLLPFYVAFAWWARARCSDDVVPAPRQWLHAAATVAAVALVLAPTFVRNHNVAGLPFAISTKASWNFWKDNNNFRIENHAWRQPTLRIRSWLKPYYETGSAEAVSPLLENVYDDPREPARPPCDVTLVELGSCERNRAIAFAFEDPPRFVRRALQKNLNVWSPNSYIFNRAEAGPWAWHQNFRVEVPEPLRWLLQLAVMAVYIAVMLGCFLAVALPVRSRGDAVVRALLALCIAALVFVVVPVGHGLTRFRLPYMVPLTMLAALGFANTREALAQPRVRLVFPAVLTALFVIVCTLRLPTLLAP